MIRANVLGPAAGSAFLSLLGWRIIARGLHPDEEELMLTILDGANLIFHEAGHILFLPFGEFFHYLAGSLTQVLIPALCVIHFRRQAQNVAAMIALSWTGQSLTNVAIYAADAQRMDLPLIGGDHDWNYLLTRLNLLNQADMLGLAMFSGGILVIVIAVVGLSVMAISRRRQS